MKTMRFDEVKNELLDNMRRGMVLPLIGSGFTRGCKSWKGTVPSGADYRHYMIESIKKQLNLSSEEEESLNSEKFSEISSIYHSEVPANEQELFLRENFTRVELEDHKKNFLSLPWPYIYTLNIDDGIECGSEYRHVVYSNRKVNPQIFDHEKCVIKLHGDVVDMLTYLDSNCEVFSQEQYIESLRKNAALLSKLEHDSRYQNLLFIGCSLADEVDLLSLFRSDEDETRRNAKYLCVGQMPTSLEKIKLKKYGITHCIVFDSFDMIYENLYDLGLEAQRIREDDLESYKSFAIRRLSSSYEENKQYLFFGKGLRDDKHTIVLPYYFISRKEHAEIIGNFSSYNLQLLIGGRCSGKTYVLVDIASRIRDKDVFLFQTKDRINGQAFEELIHKENCVVLIDHGVLSNEQFETLLDNLLMLKKRNLNFVVAANKNNRDFSSILKLFELQERIEENAVPQIELPSRFSTDELDTINPLLTAVNAGLFKKNRTIVDNIIETSEKLVEKNRFHTTRPKLQTVQQLAALIAIGTEHKIYSLWAVQLGLDQALLTQYKSTEPLIDYESTWSFEQSASDNSPSKYVLNAEYWLWRQLNKLACNKLNHKRIAEAYQYIIRGIITQKGKPDLMVGNRESAYTDYIYFDNINRLFASSKSSGKDGLELIRVIYEELNELLSVDPHYIHQRAKCYIKSSYYEKDMCMKIKFLEKAYRDANLAVQIFTTRFEKYGNEKIMISIDHTSYTQALILCHKCFINQYTDIEENTLAIQMLHRALTSPYNSYTFAKADSFNYQNVVREIVVKTIMKEAIVDGLAHPLIQDLYRMIAEEETFQ